MYCISLFYVLAQYKVRGKGGILDFCRIDYIPVSPMFGWAGIREEWVTPNMIPGVSCIIKSRKGKNFKQHNLLLSTHALEKAL
jgi:hypothetical protein